MTTQAATALVSALLDTGLDDEAIAERLGLPLRRVQRIADQLAGMDPGESVPVARTAPTAGGKRAAPERRVEAVCGTVAGYRSHRRHGKEPCEQCKAARSEYDRAKRREHADGSLATCGKPHGYKAHKRRGEEPCEDCKDAWRTYQREYARRRKAEKLAATAHLTVVLNRKSRRWYVFCPCCLRMVSQGHPSTSAANDAARPHVASHRESVAS